MRKLLIALNILVAFSASGQAPIQEIFKQDWKIIPATPNINAYQANPFIPYNYKDARVELSPTEQDLMVNFQKSENGILLLTDELKVKWQTPIPGILYALYKVNDKLIVIHNGTSEVRNEDYSLIYATVLDPATGKKILTKDILGGKPDHFVDVNTFPDPEKKELIIGFRHSAGLLKQKSKSISSVGRDDYNTTTKYELVTFNENLEQLKRSTLPVKKSNILYQIEITLNKNFILVYKESTGNVGLQIILGESQIWSKSYNFTNKERFFDTYRVIPSTLFPDVFFFTADFTTSDRDPALSLFRINFTNQEVKKIERVFTKDYRKELGTKWEQGDPEKSSRPIPRYWDYFRFSSIIELQDKVVVVAESVYSESYTVIDNGGFSFGSSRSYNENSDMLLTVYDNNLKTLDEKLIGKNYRYNSMIGNFASVNLKDNSLYIISASDERPPVCRALVMKYNLQKKAFDYIKIADKGQRKGLRRINPPSTVWFKKGYAVIFWDADESFMFTGINSDLQLYGY